MFKNRLRASKYQSLTSSLWLVGDEATKPFFISIINILNLIVIIFYYSKSDNRALSLFYPLTSSLDSLNRPADCLILSSL